MKSDLLPGAFWARVAVDQSEDGCWPWTGSRSSAGYGTIRIDADTKITHRVAWELENGAIPDGMDILHSCDNPPCCRPKHLSPGTRQANIHDMLAKGRDNFAKGEALPFAKLTDELVLEARARAASGESQSAIARSMGVHNNTMNQIIRRQTWKHLP